MNDPKPARRKIDFQALARILECIDSPPNVRDQPRPGDLQGDYDFWFDGGTCKIITGSTEYHFADGCRAITFITLGPVQYRVSFPDGSCIGVTLDH